MKNSLFTVEELAAKSGKEIYQVRYFLRSNGIQPVDPTTRPLKYREEDYLKVVENDKTNIVKELKTLGAGSHPTLGLQVGDSVSYAYLSDKYFKFSAGINYQTKDLTKVEDTLVITQVESKEKKPYEDYYDTNEQALKYFGQGLVGDMSLQSKGNSRLLAHLKSKKPVDVYQKKAVSQYIFLGRFQVIDVSGLKALDIEKNLRLAYLFTLKPLLTDGEISAVEFEGLPPSPSEAFERLKRIQALVDGDEESGKSRKKVVGDYKRNKRLVEALKAWYEYRCQLCDPESPIPRIEMKNGRYYTEVHHCTGLAEAMNIPAGGTQDEGDFLVDHYTNLVSICSHHHMLLTHYKSKFSYVKEQKAFVAEDGLELPLYLLYEEHNLGKA